MRLQSRVQACTHMHTGMHTHAHIHIHMCVFHAHALACTSRSAFRNLAGLRTWRQSLGKARDSVDSSCLVSMGAAGQGPGQGRVPDVCLWLLYQLQGLGGSEGGYGDPGAPGPGALNQKHGWLSAWPGRWAACLTGAAVCCAGSSARGGRLRCAWLGQVSQGLASGCGNLSGKHPACMWLPSPILPASAPQDLAAGPWERTETNPADGHLPNYTPSPPPHPQL